MTSDNKVCSFLLLILIGLSIYYILNNEGFNSINKSNNNSREDFMEYDNSVDMSNNINTPSQMINNEQYNVSNEQYNQYNVSNEPYNQYNVSNEPYNQYNVSNEPYNVSNEQYNVSNEQYNVSNEQYNVSNEQYNVSNEPSNIQYDVSDEPYVSQSVINDIVVNQNSQNNNVQESTNIYNFQANDESEFDVIGSNLNDAFALPLSDGMINNAVDFKKQNVDNYNAKDFLPREINDEWFETDFSLAKYQLNDDKLINTEKYIIGINTVGQSLKNASWDIRGTLPNPKLVVSPWNNSTYEPDFNLKPLC
jgi:hypothetical protein